jgi:exosortase C (VPDSG-CTERM-specific)
MNQSFPSNRDEAGSANRASARKLVWMLAALTICYSLPLFELVRFALGSQLYSYILLMPFVTIYLVWPVRKKLWDGEAPVRGLSAGFFVAGALLLSGYWLAMRSGGKLTVDDRLAFLISSWFLMLCGVFCFSLGWKALRTVALPVGLLAFMIPMPTAMLTGIETFLQYGSAITADWMFTLSFATFSRTGLDFALPGTPGLEVAPECSGIHSTWILLITSLLAGHLFLKSPWKRGILALAVIPLALLRNGFRVFTLGELSVHIGPQILDTPIHHQGGPLFFALSLIPFFMLLTWLYRSESARGTKITNPV